MTFFAPIVIGTTKTIQMYWPNLRSAEKIEPGFDRIVIFRFKSAANDIMTDQINAALQKQLKSYINEQKQQIHCNQNIIINPVENAVETEEEALRLASRYNARLVLWGDYTIVSNNLSIRTHIWNSILKRSWKSDSPAPISLDSFLGLPLVSLIGNKPIAMLHFDLAILSLRYELKREAKRHFEAYERYDRKLSDKTSMYLASQPNADIQFVVAHAYESVEDPETSLLINNGYAACESHDEICRGRFNALRGCVFGGKGEAVAAQEINALATAQIGRAGDISSQYIDLCNQADWLERQNSKEEALIKWEQCEQGLRPLIDSNFSTFSIHRKAMLSAGKLLSNQCNRMNQERGRMFLTNIYPLWKKDNIYSDALHELAHLDIHTSDLDSAQARIHDALEYVREDEPTEKQAHLYALQGEIAYLRKEYHLAASAKSKSVELALRVGLIPIVRTCDYLVYLDSFHHIRSPSALSEAEAFTFSSSPCNGIMACFSQQVLNRKLEACGIRSSAQKHDSELPPVSTEISSISRQY
jgi:hypothetical protein